MPENAAPSVTIAGKSYPLAWGNLNQNRYASIPDEVRALSYPANDQYLLWACIAVIPHPFPTWEHLSQHLSLAEMPKISKTLASLFPEETEEKKSPSNGLTESGPSPESA